MANKNTRRRRAALRVQIAAERMAAYLKHGRTRLEWKAWRRSLGRP